MVLLIACVNIANLCLRARAYVHGRLPYEMQLAQDAGESSATVNGKHIAIRARALAAIVGQLGLDALLSLVPKNLPRVQDVSLTAVRSVTLWQ